MPGLGRVYAADARDSLHLMSARLDAAAALPASREWTCGRVLDQGDTPECTAFSWRAHLDAEPNPEPARGPDPDTLYREEKGIDGIPGDGSTVRAGAQLLQQQGLIDEYVWAFDEPTIRAWVLGRGPVVFGSNWYDGMFTPDASGIVRIGGNVAGGHAYLCVGFDGPSGLYKFQNSWGLLWGKLGRFWMDAATVARLLLEQGEACTAINSSGGGPMDEQTQQAMIAMEAKQNGLLTDAIKALRTGKFADLDTIYCALKDIPAPDYTPSFP